MRWAHVAHYAAEPRARPPMRRGLKLQFLGGSRNLANAARAAPYEKGTETLKNMMEQGMKFRRRARGPL